MDEKELEYAALSELDKVYAQIDKDQRDHEDFLQNEARMNQEVLDHVADNLSKLSNFLDTMNIRPKPEEQEVSTRDRLVTVVGIILLFICFIVVILRYSGQKGVKQSF